MCRNIRTLFNFEPPATDEEIEAAALQFVRKISGCNRPSRANDEAFHNGVREVAAAARELLQNLTTSAAPHSRGHAARKARDRVRSG